MQVQGLLACFCGECRNHRGGGWCLFLAIVGFSSGPAVKAPPFLPIMFTQALTSAALSAPGLSDAVLTFNVSIATIAAFDSSCFLWEGNRVE